MKARLLVILFAVLAVACTKRTEMAEINLNIGYEINGKPLVTDTLCYVNEAGNRFLITEIQWFLSNIELLGQDGKWHTLKHRDAVEPNDTKTEHIFYIDTDIPESQTLQGQKIPIGRYSVLRFTFGLDENDNQTGIFNDSPEAEMFWPYMLGGGYHYMKLNGKYIGTEGRLKPLAVHLGIGQNEDCTEFYQNYFIVEVPIDFTAKANAENRLDLTMVIDNWFRYSHTIDFNDLDGGIMQNQTAQQMLKENGNNVFRIGKPTENENYIAMKKEDNTAKEKENDLAGKFRDTMQKAAPKPHFWSWENVKQTFEQIKENCKNHS